MKTRRTFTILFLLFTALLVVERNIAGTTNEKDTLAVSMNLDALPIVEEESYINDIPFNTAEVAMRSFYINLAKPEEEAYINDIPFETDEVVAIYNYSHQPIVVEEEAYVDDIPFDTESIAKEYLLDQLGLAKQLIKTNCDD